MIGIIFVLHIQRTVSIGNTEESVGLRALHSHAEDLVKSSARPACVLKKWCRLIKINDMAQAFNVQKFCLHNLCGTTPSLLGKGSFLTTGS